MIHPSPLILVVASVNIQLHLSGTYIDGEVASVALERVDAVGIENECLLNVRVNKTYAQEVETHLLVDGCHDIKVDESSTADTIYDSRTRPVGIAFLHIARPLPVVAHSRHDNTSRPRERLQSLSLEDALPRKGDALATAEIDDTGFSLTLSLVEDIFEAQHGSGRSLFVGVGEFLAIGIEVGRIDVGLGSHALIFAINGRSRHDAHDMCGMCILGGMLRVGVGSYFVGVLKRTAKGAVVVGPIEVIVILNPEFAVFIVE